MYDLVMNAVLICICCSTWHKCISPMVSLHTSATLECKWLCGLKRLFPGGTVGDGTTQPNFPGEIIAIHHQNREGIHVTTMSRFYCRRVSTIFLSPVAIFVVFV